jgi:hypothetical protein
VDAFEPRIRELWSRPDRLPATYRRTHGIRYFHGCYSLGDDQLWAVIRSRKGGDHSLTALKSVRAARPDGAPIYVIMDNLSANKTPTIRAWAKKNKVELCLTPTYASWANPIEAQLGPLRTFVMGDSNHPTTPCSPAGCRPTCGGVTPTPAIPTSWPPSAANAPASAANDNSAGAAPAPRRRDQTLRAFVVTALAVGGPRLLSHTEAEHRDGARLGVAERFQVDPVEAWGREADAVAQ